MGDLWAELGARLTERRVASLVLPGALYLAVAIAAHTLGWATAWDVGGLLALLAEHAADPRVDTFGGQALVLAAVVAGSTATGLVARGAGRVVERLWTATDWHLWPPPLRGWIERWVDSRRARWDRLRERVERARGEHDESMFAATYDRMARLSPERPERPTWCGDRMEAVRTRLARDHHADLAVLWPHLWLILPEEERTEIAGAREGLSRAMGPAAWALLYLPLVVWWWPAVVLSAALGAIAWTRTRSAAETYATLVEATVRLHAVELADRLGIAHEGRFSGEVGERLTLRLRASIPPVHTTPHIATEPVPEPVRPPEGPAPEPVGPTADRPATDTGSGNSRTL